MLFVVINKGFKMMFSEISSLKKEVKMLRKEVSNRGKTHGDLNIEMKDVSDIENSKSSGDRADFEIVF